MKSKRATLFILLVVYASANLHAAEPLPVEYFVKHGDFLDLQISPDGQHLVARIRNADKVVAVVLRREDGKPVGGVQPSTDDEIYDVTWASNDRLLYTLAEKVPFFDRPIPTGELYAINIDGSQHDIIYGVRASNRRAGSRIGSRESSKASHHILSLLEDEPKHILILERPWKIVGNKIIAGHDKRPIITKLNIYTGDKQKQEVLPYPGAHAVANRRGDVNFISWRNDDTTINGASRADKNSEWKTLSLGSNTSKTLIPVAINKASTEVYLRARTGAKQTKSLLALDIATGKVTSLFADQDNDLNSYIENPHDGTPAVGILYPAKVAYQYADGAASISRVHKALRKGFPGQYVDIVDYTEDGKLLLVYVSSDVNPGEYYLFDTETNHAALALAKRSWVDPAKMHGKQPISLTARDGLALHGYLTLPEPSATNTEPSATKKEPSATNKKSQTAYPLIVIPHGGPHGFRDFWEFDAEAQLFASRGYAVLQVNFRGSGGYGKTFEAAGYREWGGKMIDDILDATHWAVAESYADPDRMCIYGGSFGGYAALMSAIKEPALFQCTIGYIGVYDLQYMYDKSDITDSRSGEGYLKKVLGDDPQQLQDDSPVNHADKIEAAVMLVHGGEDERVSVANAKALRKKLKKAGKPVEWLLFRNAGHGVWDSEDRKEMYGEMLKFVAQHTGQK